MLYQIEMEGPKETLVSVGGNTHGWLCQGNDEKPRKPHFCVGECCVISPQVTVSTSVSKSLLLFVSASMYCLSPSLPHRRKGKWRKRKLCQKGRVLKRTHGWGVTLRRRQDLCSVVPTRDKRDGFNPYGNQQL